MLSFRGLSYLVDYPRKRGFRSLLLLLTTPGGGGGGQKTRIGRGTFLCQNLLISV